MLPVVPRNDLEFLRRAALQELVWNHGLGHRDDINDPVPYFTFRMEGACRNDDLVPGPCDVACAGFAI